LVFSGLISSHFETKQARQPLSGRTDAVGFIMYRILAVMPEPTLA